MHIVGSHTEEIAKILFVGQGYPGCQCCNAGSGIGTYLRDLTLGLTERGHECHVLVWSNGQQSGAKEEYGRLVSECVNEVFIHSLTHAYWPVLERWFPDSRDVHNLRIAVRLLDKGIGFDWIEIESEEGIAIGVQRDFSSKVVLRVHTTLEQMVAHKEVLRSFAVCRRLVREAKSIRIAQKIWVSTDLHARYLRELFRFDAELSLLPIGVDVSHDTIPSVTSSRPVAPPSFIVVGTPDRRKGFDRIRPVMDAFLSNYGNCRITIVSRCPEAMRSSLGLADPLPEGMAVEWLCGLSDAELRDAYRRADVLFHPARYESFGLPFVESAAFGVPIVATSVGVAPELMSGSLSQYLVDGDDPVACASALNAAFTNREELGTLLRKRYMKNYTRSKMVANCVRLLRKALGKE